MSRLVRRQKLNLSTETKIIFVAAGSIDSENEMLFAALAEACASLGEFQLIIKPHPAKANGDASIQLALQILGDRALLIPAQGNLYDYLAAADVLACIPSTIAFEAMALGVMPIVFEAATVYATNSLVNYQAALFVAHNVEVLREAIQASLAQTTIAQQKQAQWAATLPQVLGDLNTPLSDQLFGALSQINY
jgi:lipid A disaccharide synthetase